ncbi:MAG: DNA-3-methyladenine glycosylase I [Geobacteraceae bacterium]|nr:DNA-3-methyladenine glycosylase I [Geobacteraceae bacterium]
MTEEEIQEIIEKFDSEQEFRVSQAFQDGGIDPLSGRLHRAAVDQLSEDKAMSSRYGIWANTVRDNIRQAHIEIESGNMRERRLLYRAANSLSAFAELQANLGGVMSNHSDQEIKFQRIDDIINRVNAHKTPALAEDIATRSSWCPNLELSDNDILKHFIELISYSQQAKALRVMGLIDKGILDKVFQNYDVEAVAKLNPEHLRAQYWDQIGAIRFPQKLEAMIGCAQVLLQMKKHHSTFMTYLRASKIPVNLKSQSDIDIFWREFTAVQKYLHYIDMPFFNNSTSLCHLLMTLGYACIKPDSAVMGAAVKLGIVPEKSTYNDATRQGVVKTMQTYCLSRNFNIRVLDGYLLIYGGQTGAKHLVSPRFYW